MEFLSTQALLIGAVAFLLGGFVKGLSGVGLPMVALPILSFGFTVPQAVVLSMVPILASNGWQAVTNGVLWPVIKRFWPMQVVMAAALVLSGRLMVELDNSVLLILAGAVMVFSVLALIAADGRVISPRLERPIGILVGLLAGLIGGVSSLFGIPVIIYMTSLGLERAEFMTSISIIYFFAALPYTAGLMTFGVVSEIELLGSALAVVPALLGIALATRVVRRMDERRFRYLLNYILMGLGMLMILRGVAGVGMRYLE